IRARGTRLLRRRLRRLTTSPVLGLTAAGPVHDRRFVGWTGLALEVLLFAVRLPLLPTTQVPVATAPAALGATAALHRGGVGLSDVVPCALPWRSDFFGTAASLGAMTGCASVHRQRRTLVVRPRAAGA